jgi:hypothetical protein
MKVYDVLFVLTCIAALVVVIVDMFHWRPM